MSGVADATRIIVIQVFTRFDYTNAAQVCGVSATQDCVLSFQSDVLAALDYLATYRTTAIWGTLAAVNLSLGAEPTATACDADPIDGMGTYKANVDALRSLDVATVIAAGNDGDTNGISHPGCVSSAVTVGLTDTLAAGLEHEDDESSFSNAASVAANHPNAQGDRLLDILAPGGTIFSAMAYPSGTYRALSGTLMAAPHVAGAWAVLKGIAPTASVSQLQTILRDTGMSVSDTCRSAADPLIVPRIATDAAIAALRADQIPVSVSALGLEFAAVQRGTSAVQRLVLQYRGSAVHISRSAVLAPWSVTPIGCSTLIEDIADTCILELRYAPSSATVLGYDATTLYLDAERHSDGHRTVSTNGRSCTCACTDPNSAGRQRCTDAYSDADCFDDTDEPCCCADHRRQRHTHVAPPGYVDHRSGCHATDGSHIDGTDWAGNADQQRQSNRQPH